MKCDNCPAAWEKGGMTSCGYECDSYGCIIRGLYYGGEGESCYLSKEQVLKRLKEYKDYQAGKIDRPEWVIKKFIRDLDGQMGVECGLPPYPPKRMHDGCHKMLYGTTDLHYERSAAYRYGYEDAKAGKPMLNDYYAKHGDTDIQSSDS